MYRIAIADDNALHLNELRRQLQNIMQDKIQSISEFSSAKDLVRYIDKHGFPFDIIITDIDFGEDGVTGIKLADEIHKVSPACRVIFCTGYLNFATEVYSTEHTYFILKTELAQRLPEALDKAFASLDSLTGSMVHISSKGKEHIVNRNEILYLERSIRITRIHYREDSIECSETIESLTERLGDNFIQCHKSYTVNLEYVRMYRKNAVTLSGGEEIPVSRAHSQEMHDAFMKYVGSLI